MDFSRLTSYTLISKGVFYLKVYETLNCRLQESERLHSELYYEKSLAEFFKKFNQLLTARPSQNPARKTKLVNIG